MQSLKNVAIAAAILATISIPPSYGQNEGPIRPSPKRDCPPEGTPRSGETTGSAQLGDRLSESKGVICPPKGLDPGIVNKPPPGEALMPVIPPLGTPGGRPGAEPK
jgi:hypothetical protein